VLERLGIRASAAGLDQISINKDAVLRDNLDGNTATIRMAISAVAAGG
jgi:hypothetical protein